MRIEHKFNAIPNATVQSQTTRRAIASSRLDENNMSVPPPPTACAAQARTFETFNINVNKIT